MTARRLDIIGAPSSAGAYAPGQEKAPQAWRDAGLLTVLAERGMDVHDRGDIQPFRWRVDRESLRAMNPGEAARVARDVAAKVDASLREGARVLVLGGDCTIELGTVAGALRSGDDIGLVYIDYDTDMNVPSSVEDGALDWMGVAHLLGLPGTLPNLAGVGDHAPLLRPEQLHLFANGNSTDFERRAIKRLGIREIQLDAAKADPAGAARRALESWGSGVDRLLVHVDVDVLDWFDMPIAEETRRYPGLLFDQLIEALGVFVAAPSWTTLTICEVNPDHDPDGSSMRRFTAALADVLAGASEPA